jgi:hypothetical protein
MISLDENSWPTPFGFFAHDTFIVKETTLNTSFVPSVFQTQKNFQINSEPAKKVFKTVKTETKVGLKGCLIKIKQ